MCYSKLKASTSRHLPKNNSDTCSFLCISSLRLIVSPPFQSAKKAFLILETNRLHYRPVLITSPQLCHSCRCPVHAHAPRARLWHQTPKGAMYPHFLKLEASFLLTQIDDVERYTPEDIRDRVEWFLSHLKTNFTNHSLNAAVHLFCRKELGAGDRFFRFIL